MKGCVKVYQVTTTSSNPTYLLTRQSWEGEMIRGIAVSESLPESISDR